VEEGKMDALVYDAPLLRYTVLTGPNRAVEVLPFIFQRQDYGIALPSGSPLREPINRVLLKKIKRPDWGATLNRYLGTEQ
jgi:polar amino acid transport system substrate-binding protein